ncbi:RES family NAD+ phosphorylase [Paracidobacterium acidisoli]|uniref:RES domain-containing protein n=1 Tax=Paracidobacterium acidisoli TaxID=2303751 RepID=A0A372IQ99_9BACT|nr:RES domain-containing protein [Paracidobacterium acidisoli]MBT9331504.1 RES family NAD+ phosphorylase [Paracidobacterium acidisoli]
MKKLACLIIFLECILLMPLASAQARDAVVGVNLLNHPEQLTPQEQDTILDNMKNAGVRVIRAGIINNDQYLDFIQRVYAHGIKIALLRIEGPDINMPSIEVQELPENWRTRLEATRDLGTIWLESNESVLLRIPSVIVPKTMNYLFNPSHKQASEFRILETITYG